MRIPYWPLLIGPTLLYGLGFFMNAFVVAINHGQMPVLVPGGCSPEFMAAVAGSLHTCMNPGTHLKFLADWIVIPGTHPSMASPGDFLQSLYVTIVIPGFLIWGTLMVRDIQEEKNPWGPHRQ